MHRQNWCCNVENVCGVVEEALVPLCFSPSLGVISREFESV